MHEARRETARRLRPMRGAVRVAAVCPPRRLAGQSGENTPSAAPDQGCRHWRWHRWLSALRKISERAATALEQRGIRWSVHSRSDFPGVGSLVMDARARLAAQILEETRRAPTMQTCHAAAVLAGVSLIDADECDDGACYCPRCPWQRTASNWRQQSNEIKRSVDGSDARGSSPALTTATVPRSGYTAESSRSRSPSR
jgi:hypothetical protein